MKNEKKRELMSREDGDELCRLVQAYADLPLTITNQKDRLNALNAVFDKVFDLLEEAVK